jgi:hypothetical protein
LFFVNQSYDTGIVVAMVIKLVLMTMCRIVMFKAFYRTKPAAANLSSLSLECANFALSVGFIFLRYAHSVILLKNARISCTLLTLILVLQNVQIIDYCSIIRWPH